MSRYIYDKDTDTLNLVAGNAYQNMVAPEEGSPTSRGYKVGEHFIYNGILYEVTVAIGSGSTGGAIVVSGTGQNVTPADTINEQIDDLAEDVSTAESNITSLSNDLSNEIATTTVNGAHNHLPINGTNQVTSGVTFTVNSDESITLANTASADIYFAASSNPFFKVPVSGQYTFTGGFANASSNLYMYIFDHSNSNTTVALDITGSEVSVYLDSTHEYGAIIFVRSGQATGVTFKPVLKLASDPSKKHTPYAKTNRELTEESNYVLKYIFVNNGYSQNNTGKLRLEKRNGVATFYWQGGSPMIPSANTDYSIGTLPDEFIPKSEVTVYAINMSSTFKGMYLKLKTDGSIHMYGYATGTNDILNCIPGGTYFV